jgi:hypothetical protein
MAEPYMTMAEIEAKYPNEWVLIDKPTVNRKTDRVSGGYVALHSSDRTEFDRRLIDLDECPHVVTAAILYIGNPPEELGISQPELKHAQ